MARKKLTPKQKRALYAKRLYRRRKEELFQRLGGKCVGYKRECDVHEVNYLSVDHIVPSGMRRSCVWMLSAEKIEEEIPFIQLLCYECHTHKSSDENGRQWSWNLATKWPGH